jgi:predicted dehydrogenase
MAVGFPKRQDPTFSSIREAIRDKTLGEVEQVIIWSRDVNPQPKEYMKVSGTMIVDSAIHEFDLARALLGPDDYPVSIYTVGSTLVLPEACAEANDVTRTNITMKTKLGRLVCFQSKSRFGPSAVACHHCSITEDLFRCLSLDARRAVAGHDQRVEVHCERGDLKAVRAPFQGLVTTRSVLTTQPSAGEPPRPRQLPRHLDCCLRRGHPADVDDDGRALHGRHAQSDARARRRLRRRPRSSP